MPERLGDLGNGAAVVGGPQKKETEEHQVPSQSSLAASSTGASHTRLRSASRGCRTRLRSGLPQLTINHALARKCEGH